MKIISLLLAFFMYLSISGLAVPDSVILGSYNVSFDLGLPKEAYEINISEPKIKEDLSGHIRTEYKTELIDKTVEQRETTITIDTHEDKLLVPAQDKLVQQLEESIEEKSYASNIETAERKIDGRGGAVGSWKGLSLYEDRYYYAAIYYLTSYTTVTITSSYPWEEGTLSLLKTIHVEEMNSTLSA